jgi:hypothetical protein
MGHSAKAWRRVAAMLTVAVALVLRATASAAGKTVRTTVHIPATVLNNLCYGAEPVYLSGDLRITTTTTTDPRGGYTVRSSSRANNLQGQGLVSLLGYEGDDGEDTDGYYAPPPYPSTHGVTHYTRLVPNGPAPSMYLVVMLNETTFSDGSVVPTLEPTYLTCRGPSG